VLNYLKFTIYSKDYGEYMNLTLDVETWMLSSGECVMVGIIFEPSNFKTFELSINYRADMKKIDVFTLDL
jgi:hypothetical protein